MSFDDPLSIGLILFSLFFVIGVMWRGKRFFSNESEGKQEFNRRQLYGMHTGLLYGRHEGLLYPSKNEEKDLPLEEKIPAPKRKAG